MAQVVVLGEVLAALIASADVPLDQARVFERFFAGAESNVAVGLARLGVSVAFVGRVGADAFGRDAIRYLRGESVDVEHVIEDPAAGTGVLIRNASADRRTEVIYGRSGSAGSRLRPADVPDHVFHGAVVLHVSGITPMLSSSARDATLHALRQAKESGVRVSFDPNVRRRLAPMESWRDIVGPIAEMADLVLTGSDELESITGESLVEVAVGRLLDRGVSLVVVKDGARGAWATDGTTHWNVAARPVVAVDPVGAGDAFNAGFLSVWTPGGSVHDALERGAALGALAVGARGDTTALPTANQLHVTELGDMTR